MADHGQEAADKAHASLARRLRKVYGDASKDIDHKLADFAAKHKKKDADMRDKVANGEIAQSDYESWLRGQVFTKNIWKAKKELIAATMFDADLIAQRLINGERLNVFAENYNWIAYDLETDAGIDLGFTIYDQPTVAHMLVENPNLLPKRNPAKGKSTTWYKNRVNSAITKGIIAGKSIQDIAKEIAKETADTGYKASLRNARTAMTSAQNAGRIEAMHQAQSMGINLKKRWMATLDARTRDAHGKLDGQVVEVDKPFKSDLGPIMYPGDPTADPGNVYNCFVGETNVATDADIIRSYKHDYSGELITVKTAGGVKFTCTPNHPILTPSGWVAAKCLNNGDDLLIASIGEVYALRVNPHIDHTPSRIDAIHQFFDITGSKRTVCLGVNFHGDVPASDVEVITQKRFLRNNRDSGFADCVDKFLLKHTNESFAGKGAFMQHFRGVWLATLRFVGSFSKALSFFGRRVIHAVVHGFRPIARRDATVLQAQADNVAGDVQFLRKRLDGFTGKVFADNIVNIEITTVSHVPVYNLQTGNSRYFVNSIIAQNGEKCNGKFAIAHNCRCTLTYVHPDYDYGPGKRYNQETGKIMSGMTYTEWKNAKENGTFDEADISKLTISDLMREIKLNGADHVFKGIWKDDITYADWNEKKGTIDSKRSYLENKLKRATILGDNDVADEVRALLKELERFELNGQHNYDLLKLLKKEQAHFKELVKGNAESNTPFGPEAYTQARKDNAIWAKSTKTADKELRATCGEVWRAATTEEREAIYEYTQSFHKFNEPLRGIEYGTSIFKGVGKTDLNASYANNGPRLNAMTDIINKSSYEKDFWLQRGCDYGGMDKFLQIDMNMLKYGSQDELEKDLLGKNVTEFGFMSCGSAKGKGFDKNPIMFNVYAPSGTKMMYVEPFSAFGHGSGYGWNGIDGQSTLSQELETIIQQGTQFRITKVERTPNKIYIDLEVIAQDSMQRWTKP